MKAISRYFKLQSIPVVFFVFFKDSNIFMTLKVLIILHSLYCYEYSATFTSSSIILSHTMTTAINSLKRLKKSVRFLTFTRTSDQYFSRSLLITVIRSWCRYYVYCHNYKPKTVERKNKQNTICLLQIRMKTVFPVRSTLKWWTKWQNKTHKIIKRNCTCELRFSRIP